MLKGNAEEQTQSLDQLTVEELAEFKSTHENYQKALFDLGIVVLNLEEAKKKIDELNGDRIDIINHIQEVNEKRLALTAKLGEKYGDRQVDLETGKLK
jgi:2-oxo-4-hydroxy-4-carboxy--5-ureidoimidazoline (OHCU) decarboxylase